MNRAPKHYPNPSFRKDPSEAGKVGQALIEVGKKSRHEQIVLAGRKSGRRGATEAEGGEARRAKQANIRRGALTLRKCQHRGSKGRHTAWYITNDSHHAGQRHTGLFGDCTERSGQWGKRRMATGSGEVCLRRGHALTRCTAGHPAHARHGAVAHVAGHDGDGHRGGSDNFRSVLALPHTSGRQNRPQPDQKRQQESQPEENC